MLLCCVLAFYFSIYFYFLFFYLFFSSSSSSFHRLDAAANPRSPCDSISHVPFFPLRVLFRPFQTVTDLSVAPTSRRRQLTNQSCPRWSSRLETFDWAQKRGPILEDGLPVGQSQRSLILQSSFFFFLFYMQFSELFFGSSSPSILTRVINLQQPHAIFLSGFFLLLLFLPFSRRLFMCQPEYALH